MIKRTLIIVLFLTAFQPSVFANASLAALQAAFIRDNDLWVKEGDKEEPITYGDIIRYPKWSQDGYWIAYLKGTKDGDETFSSGDLWLYNSRMKKHFKVKIYVSKNFAWSPKSNQLTFLVKNDLFLFNPDPSSLYLATPITKNVENVSWFPDGRRLLVSSKKSPELHSDIILSEVVFDKHKPKIKHIYTIPIGEDEYYVSTSAFKWSSDKKWISFLLIPTASLSADSNTLCLFSFNGQIFKKVDEMLNDENWFRWSPWKNQLGYISGSGREAQKNKQLKTVFVPGLHKDMLTSKGYVDRDFFWQNNHTLIVSRSKESELVDIDKRPLPSLNKINDTQVSQITFPLKNEGDFAPQIVHNQLVWVRTNRRNAKIFVSQVDKVKPKVWINHVTVASWYYEKWHWDEVLDLYQEWGERRD
ncbi:translocation protein TolB [Neobacillus rhizosphaerae]|uniref:TolB family protein n=1 Tax=Neobacillus rhizosphaerae TaxID=2880965 RepID=UPI003D274EEA